MNERMNEDSARVQSAIDGELAVARWLAKRAKSDTGLHFAGVAAAPQVAYRKKPPPENKIGHQALPPHSPRIVVSSYQQEHFAPLLMDGGKYLGSYTPEEFEELSGDLATIAGEMTEHNIIAGWWGDSFGIRTRNPKKHDGAEPLRRKQRTQPCHVVWQDFTGAVKKEGAAAIPAMLAEGSPTYLLASGSVGDIRRWNDLGAVGVMCLLWKEWLGAQNKHVIESVGG